jgi:hypothetical protein
MLAFCLGFHFKDVSLSLSLPINILFIPNGCEKRTPLEQASIFIGLIGFKPSPPHPAPHIGGNENNIRVPIVITYFPRACPHSNSLFLEPSPLEALKSRSECWHVHRIGQV